jgi:hypothetical protein
LARSTEPPFTDARPQASREKQLQDLAGKSPQIRQLQAFQQIAHASTRAAQFKPNDTGLPDRLKTGIETLSGISIDDVRVHYHSPRPAQLHAAAFAQGSDIHIAPGQERHLGHEAWHVVQQKQGRVRPSLHAKDGVAINNDASLETEADAMGDRAWSGAGEDNGIAGETASATGKASMAAQLRPDTIQLAIDAPVPKGTRIMVANPDARDAGDTGTVVGPSTNRDRTMRVQFDGEEEIFRVNFDEIIVISTPEQRAQDSDSGEADFMSQMIRSVITAVRDAPEELAVAMLHDRTKAIPVTPAAQLQKCLDDCEGESALDTALYLYTTYFYGPLNAYLRNRNTPHITPKIKELISAAHALLMRAFRATPGEHLLPTFKMELKAEWLDGTEVGDDVPFKGFSSMHPELTGVNDMWPDIVNDHFAGVSKLALLIFEGGKKAIGPEKKYFNEENELIMESGVSARVVRKYDLQWIENEESDDEKTWNLTVYHLSTGKPGDVHPTISFPDGLLSIAQD